MSKVLTEIYKKSDIIFSNSIKAISLSFSGDKRIIELNYFYRKLSSATNVLSFPSHSKSKNTTFLGDIIFANDVSKKDIGSIKNVYVVKNNFKEEIKKLESNNE